MFKSKTPDKLLTYPGLQGLRSERTTVRGEHQLRMRSNGIACRGSAKTCGLNVEMWLVQTRICSFPIHYSRYHLMPLI